MKSMCIVCLEWQQIRKFFEYIRLPKQYKIHLLDWIDPKKDESLQSYVSRLSEKVTHEQPVLIGVSFGGIIVQEMSKPYFC